MDKFPIYVYLVLVFIFNAEFQSTLGNPVQTKVCDTQSCIAVAQNLQESMDPTRDPCDDFYQFACGNWPKHHQKSDPLTASSTLQLRSTNNNQELFEFLKQNNSDNEPKTVHKLRKLFALCTDESTFYKKGSQVMKDILRLSGLSWTLPVTPNPSFDFPTSLAKAYRAVGFDPSFSLIPAPHPNNETENILTLQYPQWGSLYYPSGFDSSLTQLFLHDLKIRKSVLKRMCPSGFSRTCESVMQAVTSEWIEKRNVFLDSEDNSTTQTQVEDKKKNKILSLKELQNLTDSLAAKTGRALPAFNWTRYIFTLYEDLETSLLDLSKPEKFKINVISTDSVEEIINELHKMSPHKSEIFLWTVLVISLAVYADYDMAKRQGEMFANLKNGTRDDVCKGILNTIFDLPLSYYYVTKPDHKEINSEVSEMVVDIKRILKIFLEATTWMDEETKKKAILKLNTLKPYLAYPKLMEDTKQFDDEYKEFTVTDSFMESLVLTNRNNVKKKLRTLYTSNDPAIKKRLIVSPTTVNAFYTAERNQMVIPAGILGPPIYQRSIRAVVYGILGSIVGHEITHGYDNTGSQYNATGHREDWWDSKTLEEYKKRARCFMMAYDNYTENFQNITIKGNSNLTLGEDIADNVGFKESLFAHRDYVLKNGPEPFLPSLENFTHEQIFTLSFANLWCQNPADEPKYQILKDVHSPHAVRINGVLKNSEEFPKIWNCAKGSNMNPNVEKCTLF